MLRSDTHRKFRFMGSNASGGVLEDFYAAFRPLHRSYWYALRISVLVAISFFKCEKCGNCCRYSPPVFREEEAKRIAKYLNRDLEELPLERFEQFSRVYYRAEKPCPFLTPENKCSIYEVRGTCCRAFPHEWLMYGMVPAYCPAVFKALKQAAKFIKEHTDALRYAIDVMQEDLVMLARDSRFKEEMRYKEYRPLVGRLFSILGEYK